MNSFSSASKRSGSTQRAIPDPGQNPGQHGPSTLHALPQPGVGQGEDEGFVDPRKLLRTLWNAKWAIALIAAVVVGLSGWYAFTATPSYRATSTVMLETREEQVVNLESVMSGLSGDTSVVNTEVEVLKSRNLMDRVVAALALENDPEFNPDLVEPSFLAPYAAQLRRLLGATEKAGVENPDFRRRQTAIDELLDRLAVQNVPLSYVFTIRVESQGAQKSADIANKIAELYILDQLEAKFAATRQATSWLTERVAALKTELEDAEAAVKDYSASASLVSEEALEAANRQIKDLRERRKEAISRAAEIADQLALLRAEDLDSRRMEVARAIGDRRMVGLAADLEALKGASGDAVETSRAALIKRFDALAAAAAARLAQEAARLTTQADGIAVSIAELERSVAAQSSDLVQLRQLQREAEANRLLYEYFLGRMKETSVQQGIQQADSRVLSPAIAPIYPYFPRKSLIVALAGIAGLLLGAALVLVWELFNTAIRGPEELEASTGLKVIGVIPDAPSKKRGAVLEYIVSRPASALSEAVRNMRTSLLLSNIDRPPQVIMVTSSVPGEGKTTTTLMLAQNSAMLGKKVLVIECDLRRRVFRSYFNIARKDGLLTILAGEAPADEVIQHDESTGLDVIVAQKSSTNAADVFASDRFAAFIEDMRERYDFVFIDTPPVLAVPDARVIAGRVDAVLYAVRWNATGRDLVRAGLDLFGQVNVRVTGLVLTQANPRRISRYGYTGYGYGYGTNAARKYYTD